MNQLYWQDRPTYNALISSAGRLRAAHRSVISGRKADLRRADLAHHEAVRQALEAAQKIVEKAGIRSSRTTREGLRRALDALPSRQPPGRLTDVPEPTGFDVLEGVRPTRLAVVEQPKPPVRRRSDQAAAGMKRRRQRALAKARRDLHNAREGFRMAERAVAAMLKRLERAKAQEEKLRLALEAAAGARDRIEHELDRRRFKLRDAMARLEDATRTLKASTD